MQRGEHLIKAKPPTNQTQYNFHLSVCLVAFYNRSFIYTMFHYNIVVGGDIAMWQKWRRWLWRSIEWLCDCYPKKKFESFDVGFKVVFISSIVTMLIHFTMCFFAVSLFLEYFELNNIFLSFTHIFLRLFWRSTIFNYKKQSKIPINIPICYKYHQTRVQRAGIASQTYCNEDQQNQHISICKHRIPKLAHCKINEMAHKSRCQSFFFC